MKLSDKWYTILKWVCLIALPALAVLVDILFTTWGIPYASEIVTTINAIAVFIGALIGISNYNYKADSDKA